jgi:hypothetical protein
MMAKGPSIDWESIAKGVLDGTTEFSIPEEAGYSSTLGIPSRTGLISVVVAEGSSVVQSCFQGCSKLESVILPSTITSIGNSAFKLCTKLKEIVVNATTPPSFGNQIFQFASNDFIIYVPDESVDTYKGTSGWSTYEAQIKGISERP